MPPPPPNVGFFEEGSGYDAQASIAISLKRIADMMAAESVKPTPSIFEQTVGK